MEPIEVVGAAILCEGRVLVARRGEGQALAGQWEFPGGKIEPGESPEQALIREIGEELGCEIKIGARVTTTTHTYDFATIRLATYYARLVRGTPTATEHSELRWVKVAEMTTLAWAPADVPAVKSIVANATIVT